MIQNDLQRLRWMILDEALRDPEMEYFMGERTKTNETGNTRSLIHYVNVRLKAVNREFSCSKRMLQNALLKAAAFLNYGGEPAQVPALPAGTPEPVTLRITGNEEAVRTRLGNPEVLQRSSDMKTNSVTIQVELPMSSELGNLLLSFGTDVEVLAPENLRDDIRQTVAALQKLYKKETASAKKAVQGDLFDGLF